MDFKDSKVNYDAISQSGAAESAPRILQTGSSCTCCLSHAISSSNIALAEHISGPSSASIQQLSSEGSQYAYKKWCGVRRSTWLLLFYVGIYVAYLVIGAWAMWFFEINNENMLRRKGFNEKHAFLQDHPNVSADELEELLERVLSYKESGISLLDRDKDEEIWQYGQGILFTVTVVTTIGYGHVTPLTNSGKLFTIVYSILGIPFTLVFLTVSVQRLLSPTCATLAYLFSRLGSSVDPFTIRLIHLMAMTGIFVTAFIVVPSIAFTFAEPEWNFIDAIYFVFISLTTIGLGDYIPGDDYADSTWVRIYKVAVAIYLLLGLVFMTLMATVYYDIPQLNLGNVLHQHKDIHLAGESEDEETTELLREGIKKLKTSIRDRARGAAAKETTGEMGKAEASVAPQIEVEDRDRD